MKSIFVLLMTVFALSANAQQEPPMVEGVGSVTFCFGEEYNEAELQGEVFRAAKLACSQLVPGSFPIFGTEMQVREVLSGWGFPGCAPIMRAQGQSFYTCQQW